MYNISFKILLKHGLHIRPIIKLVKLFRSFKSNINILNKNKKVNAKDLFQILNLGIIYNEIIIISINGKDELYALNKIKKIINNIILK